MALFIGLAVLFGNCCVAQDAFSPKTPHSSCCEKGAPSKPLTPCACQCHTKVPAQTSTLKLAAPTVAILPVSFPSFVSSSSSPVAVLFAAPRGAPPSYLTFHQLLI